MRKSRVEAAQTRTRIVEAASRAFRQNGIVATGLNDLMKAADLTRGGFYKHFESKDQLVAEACAEGVNELMAMMEANPTRNDATATYLSPRHRDHPEAGCPLAGMGAELARSDAETRKIATEGFERLVSLLMGDASSSKESRRRAMAAASAMIGAVTMARIVSDAELSAEILAAAREYAAKV
jgi:TetR/AcrR family transcriptional repressor of nem operon